MTKSEQMTSLISKKFFLNQYIYNDVYIKDGNQESEFCDCLIEFSSVYVCIQIKERNTGVSGTSKKWFNKKVLGVAKKQIKDTFRYFKDVSNTIFSKTSDLSIDREKTIIPIIVFLNTELYDYDRIVYSKTLNTIINIFNYNDFKTMLETIIIPYDIINYLQYRVVFKKDDQGKMIFDDTDGKTTVLFRPKNETDYAEMFLVRTYYKDILEKGVKEEYVEFYNTLLFEMNQKNSYKRDDFIEGLLHVNYTSANIISQKWIEMADNAKLGKYSSPFVFDFKNHVYMFFSHPESMLQENFQYKLNLCLIYYKYKHEEINKAYVVEFCDEKEDNYSVSFYEINLLTQIPYKNLLEEAITFFEKE